MATELEQMLPLAESRIKLISKLIEENQVYRHSRFDKTMLTQTLCSLFTADTRVKGIPNLAEAAKLAETEEENIVSNHVSDGDHAARRKAFQLLGFSDFANKCVYIGGIKMVERPQMAVFVPAENMLLITTPFDFDKLRSALKEIRNLRKEGKLTEDEYGAHQQLLKAYGEKCGELNERAEKEQEKYRQEGMIDFVYPEATRSRNKGYLQRAPRKVGDYYWPEEKGHMYIFPIMGWGIEEVVRPEQTIKPGRVTLYTVYGKAFQVKELYAQDIREQVFDKRPVTITDLVMARLGKLAPEKIDPHLRDFYADLAQDYDPCIEDEFQTIPGIIERAMSLPQKFRDSLSQVGLAVERMQRGD